MGKNWYELEARQLEHSVCHVGIAMKCCKTYSETFKTKLWPTGRLELMSLQRLMSHVQGEFWRCVRKCLSNGTVQNNVLRICRLTETQDRAIKTY
jgi:hypothetical protein